jgi:Flp pilus assembly secretin CpaC
MGEAKPWQIGVVVVGLLVLVGSLVFQCSKDTVQFSSTILLVDVTNGQLFESEYRTDRSFAIPAKNPKTQERTLFPVRKDDASGGWKLDPESLSYILSNKVDAKALRDKASGKVEPSGEIIKQSVYPPLK